MVAFDGNLWRNRAWRRAERCGLTQDAKVEYGRSILAIGGLSKVINWCTRRGIKVQFTSDPNGSFNSDTNVIEINGRCFPEKQLFWLLHECGHYLIARGSCVKHAHVDLTEHERSTISKVALIDDEFKAWDRAMKLAVRLNVYIDEKRFVSVKSNALNSYFRWATGTL